MKNQTFTLSAGIIGVLLLAGTAQADSKTYSQQVDELLAVKDVSSPTVRAINFQPFNPAKGTLTGVEITIDYQASGDWGVENVTKATRKGNFGGGARVELRTSSFSELMHFQASSRHEADLGPFDDWLDWAGGSATNGSFATSDMIVVALGPDPMWSAPGGPGLQLVMDGRVSLPGGGLSGCIGAVAKVSVMITYVYEPFKSAVQVESIPQAAPGSDPVRAWREESRDFLV